MTHKKESGNVYEPGHRPRQHEQPKWSKKFVQRPSNLYMKQLYCPESPSNFAPSLSMWSFNVCPIFFRKLSIKWVLSSVALWCHQACRNHFLPKSGSPCTSRSNYSHPLLSFGIEKTPADVKSKLAVVRLVERILTVVDPLLQLFATRNKPSDRPARSNAAAIGWPLPPQFHVYSSPGASNNRLQKDQPAKIGGRPKLS